MKNEELVTLDENSSFLILHSSLKKASFFRIERLQ